MGIIGKVFGGKAQSSSSIDMQMDSTTESMMSLTEKCLVSGDAKNTLEVNGTGNVVDGIVQTINGSLDSGCVASSTMESKITEQANSTLWHEANIDSDWKNIFTNTDTSAATSLKQNIRTSVSEDTFKSCQVGSNASNSISVLGDNNVVSNAKQAIAADVYAPCVFNDGLAINATIDSGTHVTQKAVIETNSTILDPLFKAVEVAGIGFMALVILAFVMLVIYLVARGRRKQREAAPVAPAAPAAPVAPAAAAT